MLADMKNHQYSMQQVFSELIYKVDNYKCGNDCISSVFGFSRFWMFLLIAINIEIHKSVIKFQLNDNLNSEKMASENEGKLSLFINC
ncbi:DDE endonuclease [Xenorhabdus miraniensis]|uniref:DDE endonuclease n=1 Tax=Xenorhabdus miraniensis TaxID=351674 RepID=A0A2D0JQ64_9GAMM|nr:DDE endonuclease [Xenorhabdus miraniensis]